MGGDVRPDYGRPGGWARPCTQTHRPGGTEAAEDRASRHHLPAHQDLEGVPPDPDRDTKLDRIEEVLERYPDRAFAFDEFGPLGIRPTGGAGWAPKGSPSGTRRHTTARTGCGTSTAATRSATTPCGAVNRRKKGAVNTLKALRSIRAARPDGAPIYVILDNLSAHKGADIRHWANQNKVELCFTPTYASWGEPDRGPLRATAPVHHRQLAPPQPHPADPGPALLPALTQRQRPPPRRARRRTPRTRSDPQRARHPLGRTPPGHRSLNNPANLCGQSTRCTWMTPRFCHSTTRT